jgi:2-polyprenyl-3-methyl-5-hydroxy-6-metoxy-1,4-benzoquinol methylase
VLRGVALGTGDKGNGMRIERYVNRDDEILNMVGGRKVLHLGCVGFTDCSGAEKVAMAGDSLHASITNAAAECVGVDLDEETIEELQKHDVFTNVVKGDVERMEELPAEISSFELIVAGDIIEHLSNPGLMLDGVRERLAPDGRLIVSTPNAFGIAGWMRFLTGRFREGAQHVLCFNPITLAQLLERHGYEVEAASSCYQSRAETNYGILFRLLRFLLERFPRFGGTLLYVAVPRRDEPGKA